MFLYLEKLEQLPFATRDTKLLLAMNFALKKLESEKQVCYYGKDSVEI